MAESYKEILEALNLDSEARAALQADPYVTKLAGALVEVRYSDQFSFLDDRGKAADTLKNQFPDDYEKADPDIRIKVTPDMCFVEEALSRTQSFIGINRSGFSRQSMIAGTLPVFTHFALRHLDIFHTLLPNVEKLIRAGFRVQQINLIKPTEIYSVRKRFEEHYASKGQLKAIFQTPKSTLTTKFSVVHFYLTETLKAKPQVLEIDVKIIAGVASAEDATAFFPGTFNWLEPDDTYLFTDIDYSMKNVDSMEDAKRMYHHASDQAPGIHSTILKDLGL